MPLANKTQSIAPLTSGKGLDASSDEIQPESQQSQSDQEIESAQAILNAAFNPNVQYLCIACMGDRTDRLVDITKHNPWDEQIHNRMVVMALRAMQRIYSDALDARYKRGLPTYTYGVTGETIGAGETIGEDGNGNQTVTVNSEPPLLPQFVMNVITPMGLGWELAVMDAAIVVKQEIQDQRMLHLTCCIPFPNHHRHWPDWAKRKVDDLLNGVIGVPVTTQHVTNAVVETKEQAQDAIFATQQFIVRSLTDEMKYGNQSVLLKLYRDNYADGCKAISGLNNFHLPHRIPAQNLWSSWAKHSGYV